MVHSYQERSEWSETCPKCHTEMHPIVSGQVESGQGYPDTVTCSACGKVIRADNVWMYFIVIFLGLVIAAPLVAKMLGV